MRMFEDMRYETWKEQVEQVLPSLLKRNLLMKPAASSLSHLPSTPLPGADEAGDELGKLYFCKHLMHIPVLSYMMAHKFPFW